MPREYREFVVTTAAGVPEASPQRTVLAMPPRVVTSIRVRVPPGPRGTMGFAVGNAGVAVIPMDPGQWIITDDETLTFTPVDFTTSGTWDVLSYNTGQYPHTIYLTFGCTLPGEAAAAAEPGPLAPSTTGGTVVPPAGGAGSLPPAGTTTPAPVAITLPAPPPSPVTTAPPPAPVTTAPVFTPTPAPVTLPPPSTVTTPPTLTLPPALPTPPVAPVTPTPANAPPLGSGNYVRAPSTASRSSGGTTYRPIETTGATLADLAAGTPVYLWTLAVTGPVRVPNAALYRTVEHTFDHRFPQYTTYTAG